MQVEYNLHKNLSCVLGFALHVVVEMIGLFLSLEHLWGNFDLGNSILRVIEEQALL